MRPFIIVCFGFALSGCAKQTQVAVAPTPEPVATIAVAPQPTVAPIIIQSNEPPPPAMFSPGPDLPQTSQRSTSSRQQPRRQGTIPVQRQMPAQRQAPVETEAQAVASLKPTSIASVMGDRILNAESPRELLPEISALYKMKTFYRKQVNNPTLMNRNAASGNLAMVTQLLNEANKKLSIVNGDVPMESSGVLRMNNENAIRTLQQSGNLFGDGNNAPESGSSGDPLAQESFGQTFTRQTQPQQRR